MILQFGGQTPLKLALPLLKSGVPIWGTSPLNIDRAENREKFAVLAESLGLLMPPGDTAPTPEEALAVASRLGYPVLVRPSYVLGGRAMRVVYDAGELNAYLTPAWRYHPTTRCCWTNSWKGPWNST